MIFHDEEEKAAVFLTLLQDIHFLYIIIA